MADTRYTLQQTHDFWTVMFVVTTSSIVASLLITLSYLVFPKSRTSCNRIIISLSVADLGTSICGPVCGEFLLNTKRAYATAGTACILQASSLVYFALCSICWLGVIAFNNYLMVVCNKSPSIKMEISFHAICWGVPMIPTIVGLASGAFGYYDMLWCSFSQTHVLEAIIVLSVFIIPVLIIITYCYGAIIWKIRKTKNAMLKQKSFHSSTTVQGDLRAIVRMSGFIIIYIITWFPYFASYIVTYANPATTHFNFGILASALAHSQGVSNFFLYCINRQFIDMASSTFFTWFPSLHPITSKISLHSTSSTPTTTPRSTPTSSFISNVLAPFANASSSTDSSPNPFTNTSSTDLSPTIARSSSTPFISVPVEINT